MFRKFRRRALRMWAVGVEMSGKALARSGNSAPTAALRSAPASTELAGMRVVVTGGTRGIGRAVAQGFASAGAQVAVISRDADEARSTANAIGPTALGFGADVSNAPALEGVFEAIDAAFGGIDLLINGAGVPGPVDQHAWQVSPSTLEDVVGVNLIGAYAAATAAIRVMRKHANGGRIINVSSGAVNRPTPGLTAYAISKHGLEGMTRQLAVEAGSDGISVTALRLGSVRTAMTEAAFGTTKASLLPDPESVVPAFLTLARAPAELVQGRSFAGWRLLVDPETELRTATPLAHSRLFNYPSYSHNGRPVSRTDPDFRVYDRAENQFGPSPNVAKALSAELATRPLAVYPDETHAPLRQVLAAHFDLPPACFAIGNGSWELLDRLLELFTQPGDEVIAGKPGWFGFQMLCEKRALSMVKVPLMKTVAGLDHDLAAVAAAVSPATRMIYLISPSNPEGVVLRRDPLLAFLRQVPPELPILLDEAYFEFADDPEAIAAREVIQQSSRPIFGLRTFSKFHALAAMRVGYAYGRAEHIALLNRGERIFNISHLSEIAAIAALQDTAHQQFVRSATITQRKLIETTARDLGLDVIASQAPYVLIELPRPLAEVVQLFAEEGIFLGAKAFYKNKYILFPVGRPADNQRNLALLRRATKRG